MIILGIETSCDETAISIIDGSGSLEKGFEIQVRGDKTLSQIELHKQYGGVFPNVAKREHSRNLTPLLKTVLEEAGFGIFKSQLSIFKETEEKLREILNREPELLEQFLEFIPTIEKPPIDAIAVTEGPGLEPCLWTGINLARALSLVWDIPIVPVNHMEGHIFSSLLRRENMTTVNYSLLTIHFPALALLISGGHTELVLIKDWFDYEIIGQTRDDAVGEAFDKVARLLGLPYPGGPEISRLAEQRRESKVKGQKLKVEGIQLPRPMLHSGDYDFSFSGIKTSVLYLIKKLPELTDDIKKEIALEFENAVTEVLIAKTKRAMGQYGAQALLLGGGVVANKHIRRAFEGLAESDGRPILLNGKFLHIPELNLTTDNALMIAVAGFLRSREKRAGTEPLRAQGNMRLG